MAADPGQGTVETNAGPDALQGTIAEADTKAVDDGIKANAEEKARADQEATEKAEQEATERREAEAADPHNQGQTDMTPDEEDFAVREPEGGEDGPQNPTTDQGDEGDGEDEGNQQVNE